MTLEIAVLMLKEAKNVESWNTIREKIKSEVPQEVWLKEYVPTIDGAGLIVKTLGKNS